MQTPNEIIAELNARGYAITPRRLTDWRQKALLPPLVKHGQGQGRAWTYVWHEADIVGQVIAVQELLRIHGHTDWLYVPLWCLGFTIPLERVQADLATMVNRRDTHLTGGQRDPDELRFRLSEVSMAIGLRPGPRRGRPRLSAEAVEYWLNLLAGDASYAPDREALVQIATALTRMSGRDASGDLKNGGSVLSPAQLRVIQRWMRRSAALPRLVEAARHASEHEWEAVHGDWRALAGVIQVVGEVSEDDEWDDYWRVWLRMVAIAGPWVSLADLSMRRWGQGTVWDDFRHTLVAFRDRLKIDVEWQQQVRAGWHTASDQSNQI